MTSTCEPTDDRKSNIDHETRQESSLPLSIPAAGIFDPTPVPAMDDGNDNTKNKSIVTATSRSSNSSFAEEGEILQLLECAEQDDASPILTDHVFALLKREPSLKFLATHLASSHKDTDETWYGHRLTETEALEAISKQTTTARTSTSDGVTWYVTVIPDNFFSDAKFRRGLDKKDFDPEHGKIKPRRPSLPITISQLFSSITKVPIPVRSKRNAPNQTPKTPKYRYIFNGLMNGWPGLRTLELVTIEQRRNHTSAIPKPKELLTGQILWWKTWEAHLDRSADSSSSIINTISPPEQQLNDDPMQVFRPDRVYRAKLRGPPWTASGWSPDSQGFCYWYEPQHDHRLSYGTNMLRMVQDGPICTHVHMIAHRYAVQGRESPRDRLTYHTVCLLEWEHGQYCTVLELAFFNGLGGYKGKSNWFHDRDEPVTGLYNAFPPEMIMPWKTNSGEIRCFDLPHIKSLRDFQQYLDQYRGTRFVDPQVAFSHAARLSFRSKRAIAQYLLNYCQRDSSYAELKRNCQTFAADMSCFLAGKKGVQPFHPVSRIEYQNRTYLFLYDAHLYK